MTAASLETVTVSYGPVKALDGFSMEVPSKGVHGLLGRNGAGKTTAIRAMVGLLQLGGGTVRVLGDDPCVGPGTRRRLSVLFSEDGLLPSLTVLENLSIWCGLYGCSRNDSNTLARRSLEAFGMSDCMGKHVKELSTGNRRAVAMARVFAVPSELVVLDEPTASLDPVRALDVRGMIEAAAGKRPVLLSTHNLSEAQSVCDSVTIVHRGRAVLSGELPVLMRSSGFLVRTEGGTVIHGGVSHTPGSDGYVLVESCLPPAQLLNDLIMAGNRVAEFRPAGRDLEGIFMSLAGEGAE